MDRDQQFLLPPDMRDWLPIDHQVWFLIAAIAAMDTSMFAARAKLGGAGRAAYHPDMLLAVLVWAYAGGVTSSRQIERRCREDVSFMVICGLTRPDHVTIARFRKDHEAAFETFFTQVLILCGKAGMGALSHIAIDGTKIAANASKAAMADADRLRRIARRLIEEATAVDAAEDARHGEEVGRIGAELQARSGHRCCAHLGKPVCAALLAPMIIDHDAKLSPWSLLQNRVVSLRDV